MAHETLITDCEGGGIRSRAGASVVAAFFLALLVGTGLVDHLAPDERTLPVGAEKAQLERVAARARFSNGSLAELFELTLRRKSRVRQLVGPYWSAFMLLVLHDAPRDVVLGPNGWVFLRNRIEVPGLDDDRAVLLGARAAAAASRRLSAAGAQFIAVPVPRKAVAAQSELPSFIDPRASFDRELIDSMRGLGVETVDLLSAWAGRTSSELYQKYDSHWSEEGQRLAAQACAAAAGLAPDPGFAELRSESGRPEKGGNLSFAGVPGNSPALKWIPIPNEKQHFTLNSRRLASAGVDEVTPRRFVLIGSSFTHGHVFSTLLSQAVGELVWRQGYQATPFQGNLARFLELLGDRPLPERIWWEFPVHQVQDFDRAQLSETTHLGQFWTRAPPVPTHELGAQALGSLNPYSDRLFLPRGRAGSSGDGVLGFRMRGQGLAGSRWMLRTNGLEASFVWPEAREELLIPIVHGAEPSPAVSLIALSGAESFAKATISLVVIGAGNALSVEERLPSRDGSTDRRLLRLCGPTAPVTPRSALLVEVLSNSESNEGRVVIRTADGVEHQWPISLTTNTVIAIGLDPLAGRAIEEARLEMEQPLRAALASRVSLLAGADATLTRR